ncbi:hypothetical protein Ahu01nite_033520 [Winogradskya humida]|uniref:Uncharacterized protein n=1 Tax=Winogradskya humida TaxID=113566 RepID=A0ABQ3ZNU1_9ACTN|nr:hypothetical protein Ahu01nite_033520 [Actinoplanes humidus]
MRRFGNDRVEVTEVGRQDERAVPADLRLTATDEPEIDEPEIDEPEIDEPEGKRQSCPPIAGIRLRGRTALLRTVRPA